MATLPDPKSPGRLIHEAIVSVLTTGVASLKVDARTVTIFNHLPEGFTAKALPIVLVEVPSRVAISPAGRDYEHQQYQVPIMLIDGVSTEPDAMLTTRDRLIQLSDRVRGVLKASQNLSVAYLHVFQSLCTYEDEELVDLGNNLVGHPMSMTVPCTIKRGVVWET